MPTKNRRKNKPNRKRSKATRAKKAAEKPKLADQARAAARTSTAAASVRQIDSGGKSRKGRGGSRKRRDRNVETVPMRPKRARSYVRSGDLQGLSTTANASSESVSELVDEGQIVEAGFVSGVENAAPADKAGVKTREPLEDDVPKEYDNQDEP